VGYVVAPTRDALRKHLDIADDLLHRSGGAPRELGHTVPERLLVGGANGGPYPYLIVGGERIEDAPHAQLVVLARHALIRKPLGVQRFGGLAVDDELRLEEPGRRHEIPEVQVARRADRLVRAEPRTHRVGEVRCHIACMEDELAG